MNPDWAGSPVYLPIKKRLRMNIIEKLRSMDHALTVKQLASLLTLGKTVIYEMVRRGTIPHFRLGYTVRFDPNEIADWIQGRRLPPIGK